MKGHTLLYGLLGGVHFLIGCRSPAPPIKPTASFTITRVALLAREGTGDLTIQGALDGQGAVPLSPTKVAFLDYDLARIVVIDTGGQVITSFGRRGGGPGEILNPRFLIRTKAGIGVLDDQKHAVVMFGLDGRIQPELPWYQVVGTPRGIVTGLAGLDDGSWVFAVTEKNATTKREALYLRRGETTRELASTEALEGRTVRLPCGITLSPDVPVFSPTLRWSASGMRVAYATTADDRITIRDATNADSSVIIGTSPQIEATKDMAIASLPQVQVTRGNDRCTLDPADAVAQRGMAATVPPIERVVIAPGGEIWARLRTPDGHWRIRINSSATSTLPTDAFPAFFLAGTRFVGEEQDSAGNAVAAVWELR